VRRADPSGGICTLFNVFEVKLIPVPAAIPAVMADVDVPLRSVHVRVSPTAGMSEVIVEVAASVVVADVTFGVIVITELTNICACESAPNVVPEVEVATAVPPCVNASTTRAVLRGEISTLFWIFCQIGTSCPITAVPKVRNIPASPPMITDVIPRRLVVEVNIRDSLTAHYSVKV